jgi:hypothetical protein
MIIQTAQKLIKTIECIGNCHHSTHIHADKIPTNASIPQYIDTRHSPTCFGTLKCHHQGVNHDPAEIGAQRRRNQR